MRCLVRFHRHDAHLPSRYALTRVHEKAACVRGSRPCACKKSTPRAPPCVRAGTWVPSYMGAGRVCRACAGSVYPMRIKHSRLSVLGFEPLRSDANLERRHARVRHHRRVLRAQLADGFAEVLRGADPPPIRVVSPHEHLRELVNVGRGKSASVRMRVALHQMACLHECARASASSRLAYTWRPFTIGPSTISYGPSHLYCRSVRLVDPTSTIDLDAAASSASTAVS